MATLQSVSGEFVAHSVAAGWGIGEGGEVIGVIRRANCVAPSAEPSVGQSRRKDY